MPERPDLDYQLPILQREVVGRTVSSLHVHAPVLVRRLVEGSLEDHLVGATFTQVERRAHFLIFSANTSPALELAVHPMLAGRFQLVPEGRRRTKDTGLCVGLGDGRELRYRDVKKMGKIYLARPEQRSSIPGLAKVGVDVLSDAFTLACFKALAAKRRDQVKLFLLDKSVLDAFGNAYADEALFAAGIHPKARVRELSPEQLARLHSAMITVLQEACAEVRRRDPGLSEKVRDFLKVRNRKGEPCTVCGNPIRVAGVRGYDAFFCATCQPDHKGRTFVSWRR